MIYPNCLVSRCMYMLYVIALLYAMTWDDDWGMVMLADLLYNKYVWSLANIITSEWVAYASLRVD